MRITKRYLFIIALILEANISFCQWTGVCNTGNGFVDNFEIYNNELYATGFFTTLCGTANNHIVKFDGTSWQPVGTGYPNAGHQLKTIDTNLYFVGYQPTVDSNWVYKFDGNNFNKLGEGIYLSNAVVGFSQTANLYALHKYNGNIIACGEFDKVGTKNISGIMQWNGNSWDSLGSGLSGHINATAPVMYPHDLCNFENDLIVCGNFLKAGNIIANGIARWDGTKWDSLGQGFNGTVYSICEYNGELYAGGDFTMSGTTPLEYIAKWNGNNWIDPGFRMYYTSPLYYTFIHTMKVYNSKLYISGGFDKVEQGINVFQCQGICAFDGTNVDSLQGGIPGKEIEAIAVYNGELYAGGGINNSNSYIARNNLFLGLSEELQEKPQIDIYPNPAVNNRTTINCSQKIEAIKVYNLLGETLVNLHPEANTHTLCLKNKGINFLELKINSKVYTYKIIVE